MIQSVIKIMTAYCECQCCENPYSEHSYNDVHFKWRVSDSISITNLHSEFLYRDNLGYVRPEIHTENRDGDYNQELLNVFSQIYDVFLPLGIVWKLDESQRSNPIIYTDLAVTPENCIQLAAVINNFFSNYRV